jgi:ABC-2 type transport system ATP-binding protein
MYNSTILEIHNLTKYYKGKIEPAVDNLSIEITRGEIFGLLGPNGAGKTTTISILCSLLKPTSGKIIIAGLDLNHHLDEIKSRIGVVAQEIALYDKLTAYENLYYFGRLYNVAKPVLNKKIDFYLERLSLGNYKHQKIKNFSGGMKRRVNLIAGVLHDPEIIFLDEPTAGVDVQTRNVIREFLLELKSNGTTLIYTSHLIDDAQKLCDRIAIIDYGRLITVGSPDQLIEEQSDCNSLEDVLLMLTGRNLREE